MPPVLGWLHRHQPAETVGALEGGIRDEHYTQGTLLHVDARPSAAVAEVAWATVLSLSESSDQLRVVALVLRASTQMQVGPRRVPSLARRQLCKP